MLYSPKPHQSHIIFPSELQWLYSGATVALQWLYSGSTVALQWLYSGSIVALQWLYSGSTLELLRIAPNTMSLQQQQ